MRASDEDIEGRALNLPPRERARLAERLIASLDEAAEADAEALWAAEAERRLEELETGRTIGVPGEKVIGKARSRLR